MQEHSKPVIFEFGEFRLDAKSQRLYRRDSGELIGLTPRAVLLLITLVCSNGRLLTKEELLDRVWAGLVVEEGNLSQTIFVLRKALGENTKEPQFILTVPARGYQFIAPVTEVNEAARLDLYRFNRFEDHGSINTEAYKSYVQGRQFWNKRTEASLKQAVEHFEHAIKREPEFAYAYEGLADSHQLLADYYSAVVPQKIESPRENANGNRSDQHLGEALTTLAYAQAFYDWDWAGADRSFREALTLDPNSATANQWYGDYLGVVGRFKEARKHIDRAIALAPMSPVMATALAGYYYTQRDAANLIKQAKKVIELAPDFAYGHFYLGFGYEFSGMEDETIETFAVASRLFGEPEEIGDELKCAYRQNGMNGVWHKRLEQYDTRPHLKNYPPYLKSLVPVRLGDKETSLAWLNQAYEQRDRGIIYAKHEPLLEPLRSDRRFKDLIKRLGLS